MSGSCCHLALYLSAQDAGPELRVAARALARVEDKSLAVEVMERHRRQQQEHQRQRQELRQERGLSLGL